MPPFLAGSFGIDWHTRPPPPPLLHVRRACGLRVFQPYLYWRRGWRFGEREEGERERERERERKRKESVCGREEGGYKAVK